MFYFWWWYRAVIGNYVLLMVSESKIPVSNPHQKHRDPELKAVSHEHRFRDHGQIYSIILPFQVVTFWGYFNIVFGRLIDWSYHSAAEHRVSTRILQLTLFFVSVFISAQVFLTPLASSSTLLRQEFLGPPLPRLPWGFHSRVCLAMSSGGFHSVWPSHPHLRFLIWKSILGCFARFHSSLFVI